MAVASMVVPEVEEMAQTSLGVCPLLMEHTVISGLEEGEQSQWRLASVEYLVGKEPLIVDRRSCLQKRLQP